MKIWVLVIAMFSGSVNQTMAHVGLFHDRPACIVAGEQVKYDLQSSSYQIKYSCVEVVK